MPPIFNYPKKFAHVPDDVPFGEHFAILQYRSIYIPGDERSRTNPGHGYPENSQDCWEYLVYENRQKWQEAIEYKTIHNEKFVPIHANRPKIEKKVFVETTLEPGKQ